MASKASMSGRPALSFCFTWMGYQRSFKPSSPACCLRGAALEETGKMRRPMSPTCTLFRMPPRAMTAQFSNSNGGMTRSFSTVHGRSRTTKRRPACHYDRDVSKNVHIYIVVPTEHWRLVGGIYRGWRIDPPIGGAVNVSDPNRAGNKISETARSLNGIKHSLSETARSVNGIKHCHSLNPMIATGFNHSSTDINIWFDRFSRRNAFFGKIRSQIRSRLSPRVFEARIGSKTRGD